MPFLRVEQGSVPGQLLEVSGERVVIGCMSFGERGESAALWRLGYSLEQVKAHRRTEAEEAAKVLGAEIRLFDAGDYPLLETPELRDRIVALYREVRPSIVLTHADRDPYNDDHAIAHGVLWAQLWGARLTLAQSIEFVAMPAPGPETAGPIAPIPPFIPDYRPQQAAEERLAAMGEPR